MHADLNPQNVNRNLHIKREKNLVGNYLLMPQLFWWEKKAGRKSSADAVTFFEGKKLEGNYVLILLDFWWEKFGGKLSADAARFW